MTLRVCEMKLNHTELLPGDLVLATVHPLVTVPERMMIVSALQDPFHPEARQYRALDGGSITPQLFVKGEKITVIRLVKDGGP